MSHEDDVTYRIFIAFLLFMAIFIGVCVCGIIFHWGETTTTITVPDQTTTTIARCGR